MSEGMIGPALVAVGVLVLLIGYVRLGVGPLFPECSECGCPMPDGYEAAEGDRRFCRSCCRKLGVRPWYWKDWMR